MPLVNNKVGDDCTVGTDKALADGKALVDSLIKVNVSMFNSFYSCNDSLGHEEHCGVTLLLHLSQQFALHRDIKLCFKYKYL